MLHEGRMMKYPATDACNAVSAHCFSYLPRYLLLCCLFGAGIVFAIPFDAIAQNHVAASPTRHTDHPQTIDELIAIPDFLKVELDRTIAPIRRRSEQVAALHQLLFHNGYFGITYQNDYTKTAQEVLQTRSGNCLSLASLYVGAARHLGLQARFQLVETPDQWDNAEQFNIVLGHVNVLVKLPQHDATVEFIDTFSAEQTSKFRSKIISDEELLARYYNNRGAEALGLGQVADASKLLQKATEVFPKFSEVWVNVGVANKVAGELREAEAAYLKAYKLDRRNFSALSNLHTLYKQLGETDKAAKLAPKIQRHQLKNPYFLAQLTEKDLASGDLKKARQHITKAIRIHPADPNFYTLLGKVYYQMGKLEASAEAFKTAIELTTDPELLKLRKQKFEALNRLMVQR